MIGLLAGLSVGLFLFLVHAAYTVATLRDALADQRGAHADLVRVATEMVDPENGSWHIALADHRQTSGWHDDLLLALLTLDTAERSL